MTMRIAATVLFCLLFGIAPVRADDLSVSSDGAASSDGSTDLSQTGDPAADEPTTSSSTECGEDVEHSRC